MPITELVFRCDEDEVGFDFDLVIRAEYGIHEAIPAYRDPGGNIIDPPLDAEIEITRLTYAINNSKSFVDVPTGPLGDEIEKAVLKDIEQRGELDAQSEAA